jgi:hypothetical protein
MLYAVRQRDTEDMDSLTFTSGLLDLGAGFSQS